MVWNWPHVHMMLNHVPILGTVFGLLLMLAGYAFSSRDVVKAALVTLALTGIAAGLTFLTGEPAEEAVEHLAGISEHYIHHHEEAAEAAMVGSILLGILSAYGLLKSKGQDVAKGLGVAVIIGAVAVSGLMARTANFGGQIRHPEIRPADTSGHESHEGQGEEADEEGAPHDHSGHEH